MFKLIVFLSGLILLALAYLWAKKAWQRSEASLLCGKHSLLQIMHFLVIRLLVFTIPKKDREHFLGDFEEEFVTIVMPQYTLARALYWYWKEVAMSIFPNLRRSIGYALQPISSGVEVGKFQFLAKLIVAIVVAQAAMTQLEPHLTTSTKTEVAPVAANQTKKRIGRKVVLLNGSPATATLLAPPTISKAFNPAALPLNGTSTMKITISNPNKPGRTGNGALTGLAFSDTFPSGLMVSSTPNVSNTCGGTVTATAGSGVISLSGGSVAHNISCTVSVDVKGTVASVLEPPISREINLRPQPEPGELSTVSKAGIGTGGSLCVDRNGYPTPDGYVSSTSFDRCVSGSYAPSATLLED